MAEQFPLEFTNDDLNSLEEELRKRRNGAHADEEDEHFDRPAMLVQDAEVMIYTDDDGVDFLGFRPNDPEELAVLVPIDDDVALEIVQELVSAGFLSGDQLRAIADWADSMPEDT